MKMLKKSLMVFVIQLMVITAIFSWGGDFEYKLGYNYESDDIDLFQTINTDVFFDAQTDFGYFYTDLTGSFFRGITMDATSFISNPLLTSAKKNDGFLPTYASLAMGEDRFLMNLNELYYEYAFLKFGLKLGRFKLQQGSGNLYSPSDLLSSRTIFGIDSTPSKGSVDGILFQGFFRNFDMELFFSPFTKMSFPTSNTMISTMEKNYYLQGYAASIIAAMESPAPAVVPVDFDYQFQQDYPLDYHSSNYGVRFGFTWYDILWKLSYYRDHFHFQVPEKIVQDYTRLSTVTTLDNGQTLPASSLIYETTVNLVIPSRHSFTADLQGSLNDSTIYYAEGSLLFPEDIQTVLRFHYPKYHYATTTHQPVFDKSLIFKGLAGLEYSGQLTGLGFKEDEMTVGAEVFNSLPEEFFSFSPGFDIFLRVNKGNFDFEGMGILAFTEIDDEYKPGTTVTGRLVYKGLDLMDVIVEGSWSHSKAEDHPFYMQKELLNKLSVGVEAFF